MVPQRTRRSVLRLGGATVAMASAGCLGAPLEGITGANAPDGARSDAPAPECPADVIPLHDALFDLKGGLRIVDGPLGGFTLSAGKDTVARGEQIQFHLQNVTNTVAGIGGKPECDIQHKTDAGWESILWVKPPAVTTEEVDLIPPDEAVTWTFTVSHAGFSKTDGRPGYVVCDDIPPGQYRFVYWGLVLDRDIENNPKEPALAVPFTVVDR